MTVIGGGVHAVGLLEALAAAADLPDLACGWWPDGRTAWA